MFLVQQISKIIVHLQSVRTSVINTSVVSFVSRKFKLTQNPRQSWVLAFINNPFLTLKTYQK